MAFKAFVSICLVVLGALLLPLPAEARRVALVIGNSAYQHVPALPNPVRDAAAIEALLKSARFDVVRRGTDLPIAGLRKALRDFAEETRGAGVAVVFYAGHGIEVGGVNYLIPIDAALKSDLDVPDETVSLDRVTEMLEQSRRLRFVILDACRDNPFVARMRRTSGASRSIGRGLARVEGLLPDTYIGYAAQAGATASDGSGLNSPYTAALVKHMATPGLDVRIAMGRVRDDVRSATGGRQEPFSYGSLGGAEIALVPSPAPGPGGGGAQAPMSEAAKAWERVEKSSDPAVLQAFIRQFPDTVYAALAKEKLTKLQTADAVPAPKPVQPAPSVPQSAPAAQQPPAAVPPAAAPAPSTSWWPWSSQPPATQPPAPSTVASSATITPPSTRIAVAALTPGSGQSARDCPECPEMVVVPAGSFTMGSSANEAGRQGHEGPTRTVTIRQPLAVGKFEVTFNDWAACVSGGGCASKRSPADWGWGRGRRPVIGVSWDDAKAYVAWLSATSRKSYRLLSEAEWEYVARARTTTPFSTGVTITPTQANFRLDPGGFRGKTIDAGSFAPNAFGLHDMHGNVWEWVEDCWHGSYKGAPTDGSAWTTACTDAGGRVVRGGGWNYYLGDQRSSSRYWYLKDIFHNYVGFRVARAL